MCASFGVQLIVDRVIYEIRGGHTATEVVVTFRNTGYNTTTPLCAVQTLDATLALDEGANLTVSVHSGSGAFGESAPNVFSAPATQIGKTQPGHTNFHPILAKFPSGAAYTMGSGSGGRSSEGGLPFWSAYTTTAITSPGAGSSYTYAGITASVVSNAAANVELHPRPVSIIPVNCVLGRVGVATGQRRSTARGVRCA